MTVLTTVASFLSVSVALSPVQGGSRPKIASLTQAQIDRELSTVAGRPRPIAFKTLFRVGVGRLQNESASIALRWPSSVDGYQGGSAEMIGTRGGSNTQNWHQSILDMRFHTNKRGKLHALVLPIARHTDDTGDAEFEIRIGSNYVRKAFKGRTGALLVTWTPPTNDFQSLHVKMLTPGRYYFSTLDFQYAEE